MASHHHEAGIKIVEPDGDATFVSSDSFDSSLDLHSLEILEARPLHDIFPRKKHDVAAKHDLPCHKSIAVVRLLAHFVEGFLDKELPIMHTVKVF